MPPEGRVAPKGGRSRESTSKGSAGGGGVAGRGRRERRDRGGNDRRENDESGTTARWHEGCSENRRGTAKGDRKRQTTKGLGWATASTTLLSLKSLCGGGVPSSHPSLGLSGFFLFFSHPSFGSVFSSSNKIIFYTGPGRDCEKEFYQKRPSHDHRDANKRKGREERGTSPEKGQGDRAEGS